MAQTGSNPDFIRTLNSNSTILDWNFKAKTFNLPHYSSITRRPSQDSLGTIFLSTVDQHIYIKKQAGSVYSPLAFLSDLDTIKYLPLQFHANKNIIENGFGFTVNQNGPIAGMTINSTENIDGRATVDYMSNKGASTDIEVGVNPGGTIYKWGVRNKKTGSLDLPIWVDVRDNSIHFPMVVDTSTAAKVLVINPATGKIYTTNFAGGTVVTSIFGRNGNVIAQSGDYNTSQVTENTNLYFTNARAIAAPITGYVSGAGVVSATDNILQAIQKINGNQVASVTGVSSFNTRGGAVTLTTADVNAVLPTQLGVVTVGSFPWANLSGSVPTFNQNTTGSAAKWTTARNVNGVALDGTANITITANTTNSLANGYGILGGSFNGGSAITLRVDTARGKLVTTYGLLDTIAAHGASAGYGINSTLFNTGTVASDSIQLASKAWAFAAFNTKNQINTSAFTLTGLHTFNANNIITIPTDIIGVGNTQLSTSGVPVQISAGVNFQNHSWSTGSASDNIGNMRMYLGGTSSSSTSSTFILSFSQNGGAYNNQFGFTSTGIFTAGSVQAFGLATANTTITRPTGATAINSTATVTSAQVGTECLTSTTAAAVVATFPSAGGILGQVNAVVGSEIPLVVINTGPNTFTISLPGSIVAASTITGGTNLVVAAGATAKFGIIWTTTSTAEIYRVK